MMVSMIVVTPPMLMMTVAVVDFMMACRAVPFFLRELGFKALDGPRSQDAGRPTPPHRPSPPVLFPRAQFFPMR